MEDIRFPVMMNCSYVQRLAYFFMENWELIHDHLVQTYMHILSMILISSSIPTASHDHSNKIWALSRCHYRYYMYGITIDTDM